MALGMTPGRAGADVVFEAAGFLPAFPEGLELVKEDGVFVEVGHYVDVGTIEVNPHRHFLRPNLRLEGVRGSQFNHFVRAVAVMESGEHRLRGRDQSHPALGAGAGRLSTRSTAAICWTERRLSR